ncbi:MAG: HpcH/HpaI aldolase family protein [Chloroflexota bacterium]
MDRDTLRVELSARRPVVGTWLQTPSPEIAEILGLAGYDFLIVDLEHGYFGTESVPNLLRGAELGGAAALVRVPQEAPEQVGKALDLGAAGVVIPGVRSAEAGRRVISLTRFPPHGERGGSLSTRELRYSSKPFAAALDPARQPLVVLQVEGAAALGAVDGLLRLAGLDVLFIGPFDLAASLGLPGEISHPRVKEAMQGITDQCRAAGVAVGIWLPEPEMASEWAAEGVTFFTISNNELMLFQAAQDVSARAARALGRGSAA